jgi:DNA-binding transcriptional regulator YhcF (GntR family)
LQHAASIAFTLQRASGDPLFVQLCDQIRQQIISGKLDTRLRLPPSRSLASGLSISRSTIVTAADN